MIRFCCFGSLNIDYVYHLPHFVRPGETLGCTKLDKNAGGKGLNQSCALAHAGVLVYHAGNIGSEGQFLKDTLHCHGVHTDHIRTVDYPNGHAIIQVEQSGENCILLFGGANQMADEAQMEAVLSHFNAGDVLVLQNEINDIGTLIKKAHAKGMKIAFNPSPMDENIQKLPLEKVSFLFVNETEGAEISACAQDEPEKILKKLGEMFPNTEVILTLGSKGAMVCANQQCYFEPARKVNAVDTTAAGDTFTGYYLAARSEKMEIQASLQLSNAASAITVSRKGAADSIPMRNEVVLAD